MDQLNEETPADLAGNYARHRFAEEIYESTPGPLGPLHCGSCDAICIELNPCTWDAALMVGACCTVADYGTEPDCECHFTGDMADASECELHGSPNRRKPAMIERMQGDLFPEVA
jgi:hypothetical protein